MVHEKDKKTNTKAARLYRDRTASLEGIAPTVKPGSEKVKPLQKEKETLKKRLSSRLSVKRSSSSRSLIRGNKEPPQPAEEEPQMKRSSTKRQEAKRLSSSTERQTKAEIEIEANQPTRRVNEPALPSEQAAKSTEKQIDSTSQRESYRPEEKRLSSSKRSSISNLLPSHYDEAAKGQLEKGDVQEKSRESSLKKRLSSRLGLRNSIKREKKEKQWAVQLSKLVSLQRGLLSREILPDLELGTYREHDGLCLHDDIVAGEEDSEEPGNETSEKGDAKRQSEQRSREEDSQLCVKELLLGSLSGRSFQVVSKRGGKRESQRFVTLRVPGSEKGQVEVGQARVALKDRREWTVRDIVEHVLPSLEDLDIVGEVCEDDQLCYVIHARDSNFAGLVDALSSKLVGDDPTERTLLWLDFLLQQSIPLSPQQVYDKMHEFQRALVYLDQLENPRVLKRAWCCLELYACLSAKVKTDFILPASFRHVLLKQLGEGSQVVVELCDSFTVKAATCYKDHVLREIQQVLIADASLPNAADLTSEVIAESLRQGISGYIETIVEEMLKGELSAEEVDVHPAAVLNYAASCLESLGKGQLAITYYKKGVEIEREQGVKRKRIAKSLQDLSLCYRRQGMLKEAVQYAEEALQVLRDKFGSDDWNVGEMLLFVGNLYSEDNHFEKALATLQEALEIYQKVYSSDDLKAATMQHNIAVLLMAQERLDEALDQSRQALETRKKRLQKNSSKIAASHFSVGEILRLKGENDQALDHFEQALGILWEATEASIDVLEALFSHDKSWRNLLGLYEESEINGKVDIQALRICEKVGAAFQAQGKIERALVTLSFTLAVAKAQFGDDGELVSHLLQSIAALLEEMGQMDTAYQLIKQSMNN